MNKLLLSAAVLALMAAPALAQPNSHRVGKASVGAEVQQRAQQQLGARPASPQGRSGGERRGGERRGPAPQAAAPVRPAAPAQNRGGANNNRRGGQPAWNNNNRRDNRSDNRHPNYRRPGGPGFGGPRHDFRNFRDYHRGFNSSRRFRGPAYRRPAGWYDRRWTFGEFLPSLFWSRDYWLSDFYAYDLPPPPYGAVWVRVGNDALLIDQDSGEVISVRYGVFY